MSEDVWHEGSIEEQFAVSQHRDRGLLDREEHSGGAGFTPTHSNHRRKKVNEVFKIEGVRCLAETPKSIAVTGGTFEKKKWIPKSQIHDDSEVYKTNTSGTLIVSFWFARKQGWT